MPLLVRLDNDAGRLADALVASLARPPADAFAEDVLLVPTLAVGRWLEDRLADACGVCAAVRVELVGRFLWDRFARLLPGLPQHSPFDVQVARWAILALFDEIPDEPWASPMRERIPAASDRDRLALAERIAGQFDRYLAYRRPWLSAWQRGESIVSIAEDSRRERFVQHEAWQRWLWQQLLRRLPGVSPVHPFERIAALLEASRERGEDDRLRARLGTGRVRLFGRPRMSPDQWSMLALLAGVADIECFLVDPCREFWEDIVGRRALARILAERPDVAWLYDGEPSILGDWGKAHRDTLAQVRQLEERFGTTVEEGFREREPDAPVHALAALQQAVLERSDRPWTRLDPARAAHDRSIIVDGGYGLARQIEVLHDRLLEALVDLPDLVPGDIVVGCADLEAAAPLIDAVFGAAPRERRIPYEITGRAPRAQPLVAGLVEMLGQADGERSAARLIELFDNAALSDAYGLDPDDVAQLGTWLIDAGVHGDGPGKHGLRAGIERLLLGAATADGAGPFGNRLPIRKTAVGAAAPLGALFGALDDLDAFGARHRDRLPVSEWCTRIRHWLDRRSLRLGAHLEGSRLVREALVMIEEGAGTAGRALIDLSAFRHVFDDAFGERRAAAAPAGGVTFCAIGALPGVPFRVVALVGLDEGSFPAAGEQVDIDLMTLQPLAGDPQPRFEQRGLFLDALLSARDRVLLSYAARDIRDASVCNASPLVTELLAYLARQPGTSVEVVLHPLQPFSPRGFGASDAAARPTPRSFAAEWQPAAAMLARPIADRPGVGRLVSVERPAAVVRPGRWPLRDLREAFAAPARSWLRQVLAARLPDEIGVLDDEAPLEPAGRQPVRLVDEVVEAMLAGATETRLRARLAADPRLADGAAGERDVELVWRQAVSIRDRVRMLAGDGEPMRRTFLLRVPLTRGTVALEGGVDGILRAPTPGEGELRVGWSAFPIGAYAIVAAWLDHVAWLAAGDTGDDWTDAESVLVGPDRHGVRIRLRHPPMQRLSFVIEAAERIAREAPPLLPKTAFALHDHGPRKAAAVLGGAGARAARKPGEIEDRWVRIRHRDRAPSLADVERCADEFYAPVFEDMARFEFGARK